MNRLLLLSPTLGLLLLPIAALAQIPNLPTSQTIDTSTSLSSGYSLTNNSTFGSDTALRGISGNGRARGVVGESNASTSTPETRNGQGVRGESTFGFGTIGVSTGTGTGVQGNGASGPGVVGTSTSGFGVNGFSASGFGVFGNSGSNIGVLGIGNNTATGVQGNSTSGNGVFGFSSSGTGINGFSSTGTGVLGAGRIGIFGQTSIGGGVGIFGFSSTSSGLAGSFSGNVNITGTLSKGAGSFKIDHPLDPANKYLSHSFVESPDMMNIYNGNVLLDRRGEAWVELPDYFQVLNRNFRYGLTAIGAPGPNLYVAREVAKNRFKISGGKAGMKVSWSITGTRQDAYAEKNRIAVEQWKPLADRGYYLYPELYGQPANRNAANRVLLERWAREQQEQASPTAMHSAAAIQP